MEIRLDTLLGLIEGRLFGGSDVHGEPDRDVARFTRMSATTAHIVLAIQFEERDLAHEHGPAYQEYRRRVPMLLPRGLGRPRPTNTREQAAMR